jgi:uncharacterized protein
MAEVRTWVLSMARKLSRQELCNESVDLQEIRQVADDIVRELSPLRIILFGSRARRQEHADSDVDLLVITDEPVGRNTSLDIRRKIHYPFALDLIICDAQRLAKRIAEGDFFLQDAVQCGKVLYERLNG